ncbi:flavohemoglobin expression-modulating QEGLA motif protein [Winogradskyella sp. SYSU M77433]|uniref:flavohemoglobin expression-modulating QEGLA motif protein n=1 Tax=Winogradskyella sp. SYSU M77433 TaxID=3042722 RepID=UPI00248007A8|nr:flavohemoglobin expression-modulating QEGLA motif protein [Winogradskyella sp. SYSU M77433]MDH7912365.1 flavohemoglobin expression-modulating QEGLA motif protein [Winogradskyella sp. SYSU M77433]
MSQIKATDEFHDLFDIDANLNRLVKNIELLNYINPLNIASEKKKFYSSKYNYEPEFKYPKMRFNGYKLHRLFFSQRLERIEDDDIRQLYEDIIYEYSGLIECIETIGQGRKFYFNSLKSFGTPTEKDIENAKFILRFDDSEFNEEMLPMFSAEEARAYFDEFSKRYDFEYNIKISNNLSAAAMVLNNTQTLVLRKSHKYSKNQLKVLTNHEIGVHMVTTFNGLSHPLKVFSNGFPNNVETQEGLAVYSEFMSNCLTIERLKELAFRVIAVDSLNKGYDFSDTFHLLHNQHKLNRDKAFAITLRVHRGGGFTKDHLYLSGLRNVYKYAKKGKDLGVLLTGKVSQDYIPTIKKMQKLGLALPPKYFTDAYITNDNSNPNLDFILKSLK